MNEIGYHGTCSKYRYSIEMYGLDPAKCKYRDDHWLGQGVYFFDYDKEQKGVAVIIGTFRKEFAGYTKKELPLRKNCKRK